MSTCNQTLKLFYDLTAVEFGEDHSISFLDYDLQEFRSKRLMSRIHDGVPRFGHTNDITRLLEDSEVKPKDYFRGVLAPLIALFVFFFLWMVVLGIFKCQGPQVMGGLSGEFSPLPAKPTNKNDWEASKEMILWEKQWKQRQWRRWWAQAFFLVSAVCIIISAILMAAFGVQSLVETLDKGQEALDIGWNLTQDGLNLTQTAIDTVDLVDAGIQDLINETNHMCPALREELCEDIWNTSTCNFTGIVDEIAEHNPILRLITLLVDAATRPIHDELQGVYDDVLDIQAMIDSGSQTLTNFNWAFQVARAFGIILAGICMLMVIGVVTDRGAILRIIRHRVVTPAFVTLVILSFCFSLVFIGGSMSIADICVDDPDPRMLLLLDRFENKTSDLVHQSAVYYVSQCPAAAKPETIVEMFEVAESVLTVLEDFEQWKDEAKEEIAELCARPILVERAEDSEMRVCALLQLLYDLERFLECPSWHDLYATAVYQTLCYEGVEGFVWVATTQFVVVFMSMVLVTARCAFSDDTSVVNETEQDSQLESPREGVGGGGTTSQGGTQDRLVEKEKNWKDTFWNTSVAEAFTAFVAGCVGVVYAALFWNQ